jgi:membrane fusion protein (multidrug efflux system)
MMVMLAAMAGLILVLGGVKVKQIRTAVAQAASFQPPPEAVTTAVAKREEWPQALNAIGSALAVHGVTLSADLPGIVERIAFESGQRVRTGDVLAELDARQERSQLAAAEAQRDLTRLSLDRASDLYRQGIVAQADYDRAAAEQKQAEARVGEIHATLQRKQIRAPFDGVLGIRQANLGQYMNAGDPVVPLQSVDPIYVSFSVPQQEVAKIQVGGGVHVSSDGLAGVELSGRVSAVDSTVDAATRNVQVQATFANPAGKLRPGAFVQVQVALGAGDPIVSLPASAINHAPYGDSVFIVADLQGPTGQSYRGVKQQFVKLGASRGDQVAVLSGVDGGQEVVSSGAFKLRNGAAVSIHNQVQPANDPAPKPEDN